MANLSDKDKRTLRMGGVAVGVYLALFTLLQVVKWAGAKRAGYDKILAEAQTLRLQIQPYETKSLRLRRLMESFNLDPALLRPTTVVADANAAIQKAAMSGGIQLGPIRETVSRTSEKDMASIQLDATGQVTQLMNFLQRLQSLGFPLVVETVQINSVPNGPGMLKMHLGITILDFEQWNKKEVPSA